MSVLTIAPHERGVIRLLALDMRPEEVKFLREPGTAGQVPGVEGLDPEQIDVFPVSDLEDPGLCGYLNEGGGVSGDQLNRGVPEAVEGWVMVLRGAVFGGREATLSPDSRLRLIDTFTEEATNRASGTIETESAKPFPAPQTAPEDDKPRRFGSSLIALLILVTVGGALWLIL